MPLRGQLKTAGRGKIDILDFRHDEIDGVGTYAFIRRPQHLNRLADTYEKTLVRRSVWPKAP